MGIGPGRREGPAEVSDGQFAAAFRRAGVPVGGDGGDPVALAAAVRRSDVADELLAGLDDWVRQTPSPARRAVLNAAAARLDPHPVRLTLAAGGAPGELDPEGAGPSPVLAVRAAEALWEGGDPAAAAVVLRRALENAPRDFWLLFTLGSLHRRDALGKPAGGLEYARAAVAVRPSSAAWNGLGILLAQAGRQAEAAAAFAAAAALDPKDPTIQNNLGNLLAGTGRLQEAEAAYRWAAVLDPAYAPAFNNLAIALQNPGRPDEAEAQFDEALRLDPTYAVARFILGNLLLAVGRAGEAVAAYRAALANDPPYLPARKNLGNALLLSGDADAALEQYRLALRRTPGDPDLYYNLGVTALPTAGGAGEDADRFAESRRLLRRSIALVLTEPRFDAPRKRAELRWFLTDAELARFHGRSLDGVAPAERSAWRDFWADHAAALRATGPVTAPRPSGPKSGGTSRPVR